MARQAFVISDLHIGGGVDLDDFGQDAQFVEFIDAISQPDTTLIINGDFLDFAQIPPYETPEPFHLLWREQDSLQKLLKAMDSHSTAFYALARFVAKGAELRIMIGNHDLDFVLPNVQAAFCQRLGLSSTDRVTFNIGHTIYDGVWIEHGHEFTPENCPVDPVNFIHTWNDERYLERVWGTDFLLQVFNELKRIHPLADKVKPALLLLDYGIRNRWVGPAQFARFAAFLRHRGLPVPLNSLASSLLSQETPSVGTSPSAVDADNGPIRDNRELRAAKDRLGKSGIHHVVFGHTHDIVNGGLGGALFNPGTWMARLDLGSEAIKGRVKREGITQNMLADASLYVADRVTVHINCESAHQPNLRMLEVPSLRDWAPKQ